MQNPGLDFAHGPDLDMLRDMVAGFASENIAPRAAEIDRTDCFPQDLWPDMGALGLHGITVEEEYGGAGLGYLAHCVAMEEVSRASASVGLSYGAHSNLCVNQIRRNGTDAQKRRYLPKLISRRACRRARHVGGRTPAPTFVSMRLRADKKGDRYVLNGAKIWITNGHCADTLVVYAKTDSFRRRAWRHRLSDREGVQGILARAKSSTSSACVDRQRRSSYSRIARFRKKTSSARLMRASAS